jgi:excisionase family DNA binding protein
MNTELIRVAEAARLLGISTREMLDLLVVDRVIPVVHEDGDKLRVRRDDVEKLDRFASVLRKHPGGAAPA